MTRIRPATAADREPLGRLGAELVRLHHSFDPDRFLPPQPRTAESYGAYLASQVGRDDVVVLVAEEEGDVVGYAYAGLEETDWMALRGPAGALYDIVVDPGARRRGVGRLLLDAVLSELGARGAPRVVLMTAAHNESAQRLFAGAGFRRTMVEMTAELGSRTPAAPG